MLTGNERQMNDMKVNGVRARATRGERSTEWLMGPKLEPRVGLGVKGECRVSGGDPVRPNQASVPGGITLSRVHQPQ